MAQEVVIKGDRPTQVRLTRCPCTGFRPVAATSAVRGRRSHCDGDTRSSRVEVARRQQRRDIRRRRGCRMGTRAANDRRTVGTVHFPGTHVVVEVDGDRFHSTRFRRRLDARKQALLRLRATVSSG